MKCPNSFNSVFVDNDGCGQKGEKATSRLLVEYIACRSEQSVRIQSGKVTFVTGDGVRQLNFMQT